MKSLLFATIIVATLASGCSEKKAPEPAAQQPTGVIPQAQVDALNKAKNVENVIMKDADRQREQADQQSQ